MGRKMRKVAPNQGPARLGQQGQPRQVLGPAHFASAVDSVRLLSPLGIHQSLSLVLLRPALP